MTKFWTPGNLKILQDIYNEPDTINHHIAAKKCRKIGWAHINTHSSVAQICRIHGIKTPHLVNGRRFKLSEEDKKEILKKIKKGMRKSELAKEYNVHPSTILLLIKKNR